MNKKWTFERIFSVVALAAAALLVLSVEYRVAQTASRLSRAASEAELVAARARMRSETLRERIAAAQAELARFAELPVAFAQDVEALKAAVEQCALSHGAGCLVSAVEDLPGRVTLEASFRASPSKAVAVLREIVMRRELFLPKRLQWRTLEPNLAAVEAEFFAFTSAERPKEAP